MGYKGVKKVSEVSSMGYVKYRAVTKPFYFSGIIEVEELPAYIKQYIREELILATYKTSRDHGIFTDKKIVLFDNFNKRKQIYTIPYSSISTLSIIFDEKEAELDLFLDSGYPVHLKFVNMRGEDKLRLRILYTCINRLINNQEPLKMDVDRLLKNDIHLSNK